MRLIYIFILFGFMFGNVNSDIEKTNQKLERNKKQSVEITQKLSQLGKQINKKNTEIKELDTKISELNKDIKNNESKYQEQTKLLANISKKESALVKEKDQIQKDLISAITNSLTFYNTHTTNQYASIKAVMADEVYKVLKEETTRQVKDLSSKQEKNKIELNNVDSTAKALREAINLQKSRQASLLEMHKKQEKLIAKMESELKTYNQRLKNIDKERQDINEILARLKITKSKNINETKRDAQARADSKKEQGGKRALNAPIEVRKIASSYRSISTTKYKGQKTIAPLEEFDVEQKFGQYFDPVYRIKVFSESVILTPKQNNSNVKAVLGGKVVFAKETAMLKKVVIIEHPNSIHTIYTYLDKIAPNIKAGNRIKKGFVIGKIDNRLGFETTLKDKHFNPLELISLK